MKKEIIDNLKGYINNMMEEALKMYDNMSIQADQRMRIKYRYICYSVIKEKLDKSADDIYGFKEYVLENEVKYFKVRNDDVMYMGFWDAYYDVVLELFDNESEEKEAGEITSLRDFIMGEKREIKMILNKFAIAREWRGMYYERDKAFTQILNDIERFKGLDEITDYIKYQEFIYSARKELDKTTKNEQWHYAYYMTLQFIICIE